MAQPRQREVDSVFRLHQPSPKNLSNGQNLVRRQVLQTWPKPPVRPKNGLWEAEVWGALPDTLNVRIVKLIIPRKGFRTQEVWLATTLTDIKSYAADKFAELYHRRWSIELFFRDLKTTMGMEVLRCKTAAMIKKEIFMHAIAYNSLRWLILESAVEHGCKLGRVSYKGSLQLLQQWHPRAGQLTDNPRLLALCLAQLRAAVANICNDLRPERREPRATKRRPKCYQSMTKPHREFQEIPHRDNYRKAS